MWIERGGEEVRVVLAGTYRAGAPGCGPGYSHGGLPPEPAFVEDIVARLGDVEVELTDAEVERAEEVLLAAAEEF